MFPAADGGECRADPCFAEGSAQMIEVTRIADGDPLRFRVVVGTPDDATRHDVSMAQSTFQKLNAGKHTPEQCLAAAFRFLLEREPKEAILEKFDVTVIARYFPEFERALPRYLAKGEPSEATERK